MNVLSKAKPLDPVQQRLFTVDEVHLMADAGVINPDERVELIEGLLFTMAPKHARHERFKSDLATELPRRLPETYRIAVEYGLTLDQETYVEPDLIIFPKSARAGEIEPSDILLLIEIADTSLLLDTQRKARTYAAHGIMEHWVVDVRNDTVIVHTSPSLEAYRSLHRRSFNDVLSTDRIPELSFAIADLTA